MNDKKIPAKKPSLDMVTIKRLLSYFKNYRFSMVFVFLCIILSTAASVASSLFIKTLIDDYIAPLVGVQNPDFSALIAALFGMAALYVTGILSSLFYNRTMAKVSQNILKDIRSSMFRHMQRLPIKYFDTHSHGEVMSHYTNDTDTLRMMISQVLPGAVSSVISIVSVFVAMISQSVWLTMFVVLFTFIIVTVTGKISARSGNPSVAFISASTPLWPITFAISWGSAATVVVPQAITAFAKLAGIIMLLSRCIWASTKPGRAYFPSPS